MSAVATAIVGGAVLSGVLNSNAASSAANTAAGASDRANALSDAQFQQTRTDMAPWRQAGTSAIGQLAYLLGLPGYEPSTTQLGTLGRRGGATLPAHSPRTPAGGATPALPGPGAVAPTPSPRAPMANKPMLGMNEDDATMAYGAGIYQPSMDDPTSTTNSGGGGGGRNFDSDGFWDGVSISASAVPQGNTYNTQLGDFGSLSRDFGMADFQADPGYDFRLKEGQKALERSAAAGGRYLGGGTLKALTRYGQDMGSQEYGRAFDRFNLNRNTRFNQLAAVSGIGQTANSQLAQLGAQNAITQGNNITSAATAAGNASLAGAAGWTSALNNGVNNWLAYGR